MTFKSLLAAAATALILASPAFAQTNTENDTQRDVNQQNRIEQGLQSGQLNSHEAGRLEQGETRVDNAEAKADANGSVSPTEQAHINSLQNKESAAVYSQKHDAQTGNPASASSQRLQTDVQRNANQETRIENGEKSGALTNREASHLQAREARNDKAESKAAAHGGVNAREQARIQRRQNRNSARVYNQKHDAQVQ